MTEENPMEEGSTASNVSGENSDSMVELNIKTLESQVHKFQVDKNMPVSLFKEKIANEIGVPVGQQRLIFRGKLLKDDHLLSEYHVENGHTLHLVQRQLSQSSSDTGNGETSGNNSNHGNESSTGNFPNRVGQISHSVVLGTFNVGDQGGAVVRDIPDVSRVIGAVLNSFGIGGQIPGSNSSSAASSTVLNIPDQAGNQSQSGQPSQPLQAFQQGVQIPLAAEPTPSIQAPIPDSLNTLVEFMYHMEQALLQNGNPPDSPSTSTEGMPRVELPSGERGVPMPEALCIILRRAQQLLSNRVPTALSHMAGLLEQEGNSPDRTVRGQVQVESAHLGLVMQHLGALFLELGRAVLTLRMGQSPAESSVNAGPAVYISPSGPNPLMVHPFLSQTSQLFGGSTPSNSMGSAAIGIGSAPRNVNIHIHAGNALATVASRAGGGDSIQDEHSNGASSEPSGGSGTIRIVPQRTVIAAFPQQGGAIPTATQSGLGSSASQPSPDPVLLSSAVADVNSALRSILGSAQESNVTSSGHSETSAQGAHRLEDTWSSRNMFNTMMAGSGSSSESVEGLENERVPLGLGMGSLERKRSNKQLPSQVKSGDGGTPSGGGGQSSSQQQLLQSLARNSSGSSNAASAMSQVLQNPAMDGLVAGFSQQTGVGSPDVLRSMLQQFTQNPEIMNTVTQLAQQIDSRELPGSEVGPGGGLDLSRMVQQMMPVVSRALSRGATGSQSSTSAETESLQQDDVRSSRDVNSDYQNPHIDVRDVTHRIESYGTHENIFRAVVENATRLHGSGEDLAAELFSNPSLASEYVELLQRELSRRLQDEFEQEKS